MKEAAADGEAPHPAEALTPEEMSSVLDRQGVYQRRLFLMALFPLIINGYQTMSVVLTFASPQHRCQVPELPNDTFSIQNEKHRMAVNLSIPMTSSDGDVSYSKCDVYTDRDESHANRTKYGDTESCHSWVYDDTDFESTMVTQFDLVCERKGFRANFNMIYMVGLLLGCPVIGMLCDRFGRKTVLVVSIALTIAVCVAAAFPVVTPLLLVYRFLLGFLDPGIYMALYVLCLEFMGPEQRTLAGSLMMVLWVLGPLLVGALSYVLRDWRWLQLLNGAPFIFCLSYWWLMDESPRWLLAEGRVQEARKVILKVMRVNKIPLDLHQHGPPAAEATDGTETQTDEAERMTGLAEDRNGQIETDSGVLSDSPQLMDQADRQEEREETGKNQGTPPESALQLFKFPNLLVRTGIIFFNWAAVSMTYYGLSLNVGNLGGDIRFNFFLSNLVELVGCCGAWLLLDRLGRKRTHCAAMLLSGLACLATVLSVLLGGVDVEWVTIALVMAGKMGISAAFSTVYLLSGELFPTVIRNQCMGWSSTVGGMATVLSPYISDLSLHIEGGVGRAVPVVIFGAVALAAGLLALCLPETLHRTLPDTILQAATFTHTNDVREINLKDNLETKPLSSAPLLQ